jgi:hypothetical protein
MSDGKNTGLRPRTYRTGADAYFWPERKGKPIRPDKKGSTRQRHDRSLGEMLLWLIVIVIALISVDAYFFGGEHIRELKAKFDSTSQSWRSSSDSIWGA